MSNIQSSYRAALTDIRETKHLLKSISSETKEASVDQRISQLSKQVQVLEHAKSHLQNDIKLIKNYYDDGFSGFFRQIIDFFIGSPVNEAKKQLKIIEAKEKELFPLVPEKQIEILEERLGNLTENELEEELQRKLDENDPALKEFFFEGGPLDKKMENRVASMYNTLVTLNRFSLVYPDSQLKLTGDLQKDNALAEALARGIDFRDIKEIFNPFMGALDSPRQVLPLTEEENLSREFLAVKNAIVDLFSLERFDELVENKLSTMDRAEAYETALEKLKYLESQKKGSISLSEQEDTNKAFIDALFDKAVTPEEFAEWIYAGSNVIKPSQPL